MIPDVWKIENKKLMRCINKYLEDKNFIMEEETLIEYHTGLCNWQILDSNGKRIKAFRTQKDIREFLKQEQYYCY